MLISRNTVWRNLLNQALHYRVVASTKGTVKVETRKGYRGRFSKGTSKVDRVTFVTNNTLLNR